MRLKHTIQTLIANSASFFSWSTFSSTISAYRQKRFSQDTSFEDTPVTPLIQTSTYERTATDLTTTYLTIETIRDLIVLDQTRREHQQPGVERELRALIEGKTLAQRSPSLTTHGYIRRTQAARLWELGIGRALGFSTFEAYVATIPFPSQAAPLPHAPHLILVDERLSWIDLCTLMNIQIKMDEPLNIETDSDSMQVLLHKKEGLLPRWILCNDGHTRRGLNPRDAETTFAPYETSLTVNEGLFLCAQRSTLLEEGYLDCSATAHPDHPHSVACLGMWNGQLGLRWRWNDQAHEDCGTGSRLSTG